MINRNQGLDIARSAAIMGVLVAHFLGSTFLWILGILGVELFFALSGYLIGRILFRDFQARPATQSVFSTLRHFWMRRWMRTLPAYLTVLAMEALAWHFVWHGSLASLPKYLVFLQNFAVQDLAFFFVSWSLSIEEWFYLLFAVGVAVATITKRRDQFYLKWLFVLWIVGFPLFRYYYATQYPVAVVRSLVVCRLDSIIYGVLIAYVAHFRSQSFATLATTRTMTLGFGLAALGTFLAYQEGAWAVTFAYAMIPAGFALMLPAFSKISFRNRWVAVAIEGLSKLSYSLYLVHVLIFMLMEHYFAEYYASFAVKFMFRSAALAISFSLAYTIYRLIEKPGMALRDKYFPNKTSKDVLL